MASQRSNRFTVEISGNPVTTANMIKQLSTNPFMLLNPENHLATMLPDALNTTDYAPKIGISVKDIHFLLLGGLALTTEVVNAGVHFIIDPARLTKLFTDMDAHGASFLPIQGNASIAMPRAHFSLTDFIARLPIECRVIEADEVFYDGPPDNAGTGTCYDWLTPRLLITGEAHERHALLSQFVMMLPDYHFKGTPATGGRSSKAFHRHPRADAVGNFGIERISRPRQPLATRAGERARRVDQAHASPGHAHAICHQRIHGGR